MYTGRLKSLFPYHEVEMRFSRTSGPGGQHVNKTNSATQVRWNIGYSQSYSESEKNRIRQKLAGHINKNDELLVECSVHRDRDQNIKGALAKLELWISKALHVPKARKATKPTRSSIRKRLDEKRITKEKKQLRQKI